MLWQRPDEAQRILDFLLERLAVESSTQQTDYLFDGNFLCHTSAHYNSSLPLTVSLLSNPPWLHSSTVVKCFVAFCLLEFSMPMLHLHSSQVRDVISSSSAGGAILRSMKGPSNGAGMFVRACKLTGMQGDQRTDMELLKDVQELRSALEGELRIVSGAASGDVPGSAGAALWLGSEETEAAASALRPKLSNAQKAIEALLIEVVTLEVQRSLSWDTCHLPCLSGPYHQHHVPRTIDIVCHQPKSGSR